MYQERISRVLAAMERMGLEQMLVSDPDSIWYLTGYDVFPFERLYAFYLRKDGQHKLFLNKLFPVPEAPYEQVWFSDTDDYLAILANAVDGEKDMGVDKDWPARFLLPLMAHNPNCKYVLASDCVDDARACKDAVERDLMREASRINDVVMERAAAYMKEGMTEREVVALHSGQPYRIYMLGFLPGFPYLGGLDERLHTPRLSTPRTRIPAGSVGIGGKQTGVYPMESPGGWQLIGRTPLKLFDPAAGMLPYAAGDRIRFVPIDEGEFERIQKREEAKRHGA